MRRLLLPISAAALLIAPLTPVGDASANAVSQYKKTSYRDGGVVLRMSTAKGSVLSPGEEISFTYQTADDALVVLFNIDSEGYVHLLHPFDGYPSTARARETYRVPAGSDKLLVSGETGMEFVFALTIPDRAALDETELNYLRGIENRPLEERYRIDGDPFLAANIIAGELVRGVSHRGGVFLDYTYFYVNQRVDHPCYLCGECGGGAEAALCEGYDLVADLDRAAPLTYPLERAYVAVERGAPVTDEDIQVAGRQEYVDTDDDVNVTFYPYSVEVRYVTRPRAYAYDVYWYDPVWYDPLWYDPWYSGYVYYPSWRYPYLGHYFSWSFAWGYWGGYYCSGWYYPRYHYWHDYYYDRYWHHARARSTVKYKSAYKHRSTADYKNRSALTAVRSQSVKRSDALRIASKDLKRSTRATRVAAKDIRTRTAVRSAKPVSTHRVIGKTRVTTRSGKSITGRRVPTRVRGKAPTRTLTRPPTTRGTKSIFTPRSRSTTRKGSAVKRGGTSRSRPSVKSPTRSGSRSKSSVKSSRTTPRRSTSSSVKRSSGSRSRAKSSRSSSRSSSGSGKRSSSKGKRK
jgi:hypothetical protein